MVVAVPSIQFIETFGNYENRLNEASGPTCNPDNYQDPDNYPLRVFITEGMGAERAGMIDGDEIIKINDIPISNFQSLNNDWPTKFSDVKPGDVVRVNVIRDGNELLFDVQTSPRAENPSEPMLGVLSFEEPTCLAYFILKEGSQFGEDDLRYVLGELWFVVFLAGSIGVLLIIAFFYWMPQIRKLTKEIDEWEGQYLDESYLLTFETNVPVGDTDGEKIFNMAQDALPELKKDYIKHQKWKGKVVGNNNYEFDCFQVTHEKEPRLFVAKHFGDTKIDSKKLQELCDAVENSMKYSKLDKKFKGLEEMEVLRVSCVGRNYDPKFFVDETRDEILDSLDTDYNLDLIHEKEDGNYTILSIEY